MEAIQETGTLIASDKVQGTGVFNAAGDNLGAIHELMIDKPTGKVAYAIMSFGGFLGIGNQFHPLPWSILKYDTTMGGYVVNLDKRKLQGAPPTMPTNCRTGPIEHTKPKFTTTTASAPTGRCDSSALKDLPHGRRYPGTSAAIGVRALSLPH